MIYFNVPFLAIPLPNSKDNHQFYNAKDYFDKKLCWLASQTEYKKENLKELILSLIRNPNDYFEKKNNMIKFYDNSNIFILPSFTEGHPMVLLESLARLRPVIIFNEINILIFLQLLLL